MKSQRDQIAIWSRFFVLSGFNSRLLLFHEKGECLLLGS